MVSLHERNDPAALSSSDVRGDGDELIDSFRAQSPRAWAEIVSVYRPRVYALALRMTRNHHDAEDITQETFVRAFRSAARFRGDSSLGTWLHRIAANLSIKHYWYWRRRKRDETLSLDCPVEGTEALTLGGLVSVDDPRGRPESETDFLLKQIQLGMTRLSETDRNILILRERQHASYQEISHTLAIPLGTVKSRVFRARDHLRVVVQRMNPAEFGITGSEVGAGGTGAITKSMSGAKNTALGE